MREGIDCKGIKYIERPLGKGKDISNKRNNKLIACFPVYLPNNDYKSEGVYWLCECDCGNQIVVNGRKLVSNTYESCGCLYKEKQIGTRLKDLTNQTFGKLTVIERDLSKGINTKGQRKKVYWKCKLLVIEKVIINNQLKWKCRCDCGNITYVNSSSLLNGHTKSCGCLQKEVAHNNTFIDLTGQQFGKLTVLELAPKKNGCIMWRCQCECGNIIETRGTDLRYRKNRSCGCSESKGEQIITNLLIQNNIPFIAQKRFETCRNPETNAQLIFDFYINNSFLLEYDGIQHYKTSSGWNTQEHLDYTQTHDNIKNHWCKEHNIPLKRIPYWELNNITIENIMDDTFLII